MMKKNIINGLYVALVASFAFVSCTNDVDQDYKLSGNESVATIAVDQTALLEKNDATTAVNETVASFVVTVDKPHITNMKFKLEFLAAESTGTLDDIVVNLEDSPIDFGSDGYLITIPRNELTTSFSISSVFDETVETSETFKFKVYPVGDLNGVVAADSQTITLTVGNSTDDTLRITFDWNGDAEWKNQNNEFRPLSDFDFDLEIYNSSLSGIIATSYSDSPEKIELDPTTYADGTYFIVPSFWSNPVGSTDPLDDLPMLPINFSPKVTVSKPGIFVREFDLAGIWNSTAGGNEQGNPDAYQILAYFVKTTDAGTGEAMYELYDADNNLLDSGRMANLSATLGLKSKKLKK